MPDLAYRTKRFGWLKDYPSLKDYSPDDAIVKITPVDAGSRSKVKQIMQAPAKIAAAVDNRKFCSPVRDQGDLGSCTAFMATSMYEYMCKRGHAKHIPLSPLFTYKSTRWLMKLTGDTGAYIRSALGSLVIHGSPPEEYYPYKISRFDNTPDVLNSSFAQSFQALTYFRLDKGIPSDQSLVNRMKDYIARGFCLGIGFTVYESFEQAESNGGMIPYPEPDEEVLGGHAVMLCGYEGEHFTFKNSWGNRWGLNGFGQIPMKYFIRQANMDAPLADDIWAITKYEWLNVGDFGFND